MNYKLFFFACAFNLFYYVPNLLASPIIGGQEDTSHTYKYHVSIRHSHNPKRPNSGEDLCGGTIIHDRYVLSVAHSFMTINHGRIEIIYRPKRDGIVVLSGTSETSGSGIITQVDKIFIPDEYNSGVPFYADISVLKLTVYLNVHRNRKRLQILPIYEGQYALDFFVHKKAIIVGNGDDTLVNGYPAPTVDNRRQFLTVRITPRNVCQEFYYAICALNLDRSRIRTCSKADGGSPLVFDNTVIGVVSIVSEDCNSRTPIVCTRTSTFINFIRNAMNELGDHSKMHILEN